MKTKWVLLVLLAIVFSPSFLHAEDADTAAAAATANAAAENTLLGAADQLDDFSFDDGGEDLIDEEEDLALDENFQDPAIPVADEAEEEKL